MIQHSNDIVSFFLMFYPLNNIHIKSKFLIKESKDKYFSRPQIINYPQFKYNSAKTTNPNSVKF